MIAPETNASASVPPRTGRAFSRLREPRVGRLREPPRKPQRTGRDQEAGRHDRDERAGGAESRQQECGDRQGAEGGAERVDRVQATGADAERLGSRRDQLRKHGQRSAHAGRRHEDRDDRDADSQRDLENRAPGRRVVEPREDGLHRAEERLDGQGRDGGDDFKRRKRQ